MALYTPERLGRALEAAGIEGVTSSRIPKQFSRLERRIPVRLVRSAESCVGAHSFAVSKAAYLRTDLFEQRRVLMDDWSNYISSA